MKCDDCKFMRGEGVSMDYPYPVIYCIKGHWEGLGPDQPKETDPDPWADCKDFELWDGPQTVTQKEQPQQE